MSLYYVFEFRSYIERMCIFEYSFCVLLSKSIRVYSVFHTLINGLLNVPFLGESVKKRMLLHKNITTFNR